jgi:hypothetical protein
MQEPVTAEIQDEKFGEDVKRSIGGKERSQVDA